MIYPDTASNDEIQRHIQSLEDEIKAFKKRLAWRGKNPIQKYGWREGGDYILFETLEEAVTGAEAYFGPDGRHYLQKIWVPSNA